MSSSPWIITRAKRKSSDLETSSHKRQKVSIQHNPREVPKSAPTKRLQQQTLTQVQWSPSANHDVTGQRLRQSSEDHVGKRTPGNQSARRSNSTLTQMAFFKTPTPEMPDSEDELLELSTPTSEPRTIIQFDGGDENPQRNRRPNSATTHVSTTRSARKRREIDVALDGPRNSSSTPSEKSAQSLDSERVALRRSSRRSSLTNSLTSKQHRQDAPISTPTLTTSMSSFDRDPSPSKQPKDIRSDTKIKRLASSKSNPRRTHRLTPQKTRFVVPSSQSPETLSPPSTRKSKRSLSLMLSPVRQPLRSKSANLILIPNGETLESPQKSRSKSSFQSGATSSGLINADDEKENYDAILKLTQKPPSTRTRQKQKSRSRLSQEPNDISAVEVVGIPRSSGFEMANEIYDTNLRVSETSSKLTEPSVRGMVGEREILMDRQPDGLIQPSVQPPHMSQQTRQISRPLRDQQQSVPLIRQHTVQDSQDDFGSPVRNDTQFEDLLARFTSPASCYTSHEQVCLPNRADVASPTTDIHLGPDREAVKVKARLVSSVRQEDNKLPPQPAYVPQVDLLSGALAEDQEASRDEFVTGSLQAHIPLPKHPHKSTRHAHVHNSHSPSSSDPSDATTASVNSRPASMPHPSQLSTQAPTQGFLLGSSPKASIGIIHDSTDTFTVKDSSSSAARMSQIPPYIADSEESDLDLDLEYHPISKSTLRGNKKSELSTDMLDLTPTPACKVTEPDTMKPSRLESVRSAQPREDPLHNKSSAASKTDDGDKNEPPPSSISTSEFLSSSPPLPPLQREHSPLEGFDNDTQSNFTQNGHITAAYVHRQRETGIWPDWFNPKPFQVPNYKRPEKKKRSEKRRRVKKVKGGHEPGSKT